jgi:hypothetical protein
MVSREDNSNKPVAASGADTDTSYSFYKELEKELVTRGLTAADGLYTGNRTLAILGDFFYDDWNARDYERGILLKAGKRDFIGKTICLSRNKINHLLTAYCEVSGMGVYRVAYAVSWDGKAELSEIEKLLLDSSLRIDVYLYKTLKSQESWRYLIADLEKNTEPDGNLLF